MPQPTHPGTPTTPICFPWHARPHARAVMPSLQSEHKEWAKTWGPHIDLFLRIQRTFPGTAAPDAAPDAKTQAPPYLHYAIHPVPTTIYTTQMAAPPSLLPFVLNADNFPHHTGTYPTHHPETNEHYTPFHVAAADHAAKLYPVGLLRPAVLIALVVEEGAEGPYEFVRDPKTQDIECVAFTAAVLAQGHEAMNAAIAATAARWKQAGKFPEALDGALSLYLTPALAADGFLKGWRNELYAIYASPKSAALTNAPRAPFGNLVFGCERAACAVFGFATFGVHMTGKCNQLPEGGGGHSLHVSTAYEGEGQDMKIWVPRRSPTKATWPGMLDNVSYDCPRRNRAHDSPSLGVSRWATRPSTPLSRSAMKRRLSLQILSRSA